MDRNGKKGKNPNPYPNPKIKKPKICIFRKTQNIRVRYVGKGLFLKCKINCNRNMLLTLHETVLQLSDTLPSMWAEKPASLPPLSQLTHYVITMKTQADSSWKVFVRGKILVKKYFTLTLHLPGLTMLQAGNIRFPPVVFLPARARESTYITMLNQFTIVSSSSMNLILPFCKENRLLRFYLHQSKLI